MTASSTITLDPAKLASWVSRLVQIPSVNPMQAGPKAETPGELAVANAVAEWLGDVGGDVEMDESREVGRPNVYARFDGESDTWVSLDVHIDTVGVEHMTDPPFDGRIEDGFVWGRGGTLDTKASMGVMLALLEEMAREGRKPKHNLLVVGTISEEGGGMIGAEMFRDWLQAQDWVLDQLIVAEPTSCGPLHGHKGGLGLDVVLHGEAAHSSRPDLGENAIVAAARVILALEAEHERLIALPPHTEVGTGTVGTTIVNGGSARNIIPDRCELAVGRRIAPGEDPEAEYQRLRTVITEAAQVPVDIDLVNDSLSSGFYRSPETELVKNLAAWSGVAPTCAPFGTNAIRYEEIASEMVILGPGSIDYAHKATERVSIEELELLGSIYQRWLT